MKNPRRPGHSLLEVCVVAFVLTLTAACLVPALAQVKEMEARATSIANLKHLGVAVHVYEGNYEKLIEGNDDKNFSVHAKLLLFVEKEDVSKKLDFKSPCDDKANAEAAKVLVKVFVSPRDSLEAKKDQGVTNYLFNAGSKYALADNDGVFFKGKAISIADIKDGTSNTIMVGETLRGDPNSKADDVARRHVQINGKDALEKLKDDSGVVEFKDGKNVVADRGSRWVDGRFLQTTFNTARAPNDARPDVTCSGHGGLGTLRSPDDSILVGFCDGSVRALKATIKHELWKALSTRAGGEKLEGKER